MDPLTAIGAVASICQLAQTALSLSKTLYSLGSALSSASEDIQILADDLKTFAQSLTLLSRLLEDSKSWYSDDIYLLTAKIIKDCADLYVKIDKVLTKLGGNGKNNWKLRVKFVYKEGEIRKLLKRLRDMKGTLATILMSLQVDLQLSLLNISSSSSLGSDRTERSSETPLQPQTLETLKEAQRAVESGGFLPKYTAVSEKVVKVSEKEVCISTIQSNEVTLQQLRPSFSAIATPPPPMRHGRQQEFASRPDNASDPFIATQSFMMIPPKPENMPPIRSQRASSGAVIDDKKVHPEASLTTITVAIHKTRTSIDCDTDMKSLKSSSSVESFKSAKSIQDTELDVARKVKAVQSVMHAFRTALQILDNLVERRIPDKDGDLYFAAKDLEEALDEGKDHIDHKHICHFKQQRHKYLSAFTDEHSTKIQGLGSNLMQDVVMKLHEYSAEHEVLVPSGFDTLSASTDQIAGTVVTYLDHLCNSISSFDPQYTCEAPQVPTSHGATPHLVLAGGDTETQPSDASEMSLPFIGYTFKRIDNDTGIRGRPREPESVPVAIPRPPLRLRQYPRISPEIPSSRTGPRSPQHPSVSPMFSPTSQMYIPTFSRAEGLPGSGVPKPDHYRTYNSVSTQKRDGGAIANYFNPGSALRELEFPIPIYDSRGPTEPSLSPPIHGTVEMPPYISHGSMSFHSVGPPKSKGLPHLSRSTALSRMNASLKGPHLPDLNGDRKKRVQQAQQQIQRDQVHQRSNSRNSQPPAAPTSSHPQFPIRVASLNGTPAYAGNNTVAEDTLRFPAKTNKAHRGRGENVKHKRSFTPASVARIAPIVKPQNKLKAANELDSDNDFQNMGFANIIPGNMDFTSLSSGNMDVLQDSDFDSFFHQDGDASFMFGPKTCVPGGYEPSEFVEFDLDLVANPRGSKIVARCEFCRVSNSLKCDGAKPSCSRCLERKQDCVYPESEGTNPQVKALRPPSSFSSSFYEEAMETDQQPLSAEMHDQRLIAFLEDQDDSVKVVKPTWWSSFQNNPLDEQASERTASSGKFSGERGRGLAGRGQRGDLEHSTPRDRPSTANCHDDVLPKFRQDKRRRSCMASESMIKGSISESTMSTSDEEGLPHVNTSEPGLSARRMRRKIQRPERRSSPILKVDLDKSNTEMIDNPGNHEPLIGNLSAFITNASSESDNGIKIWDPPAAIHGDNIHDKLLHSQQAKQSKYTTREEEFYGGIRGPIATHSSKRVELADLEDEMVMGKGCSAYERSDESSNADGAAQWSTSIPAAQNTDSITPPPTISSLGRLNIEAPQVNSLEKRRQEILVKNPKLAELRLLREIRQQESLGKKLNVAASPEMTQKTPKIQISDYTYAQTLEMGYDQPSTPGQVASPKHMQKFPAVFLCKVQGCGKRFTRRFNLEAHMYKNHSIQEDADIKITSSSFDPTESASRGNCLWKEYEEEITLNEQPQELDRLSRLCKAGGFQGFSSKYESKPKHAQFYLEDVSGVPTIPPTVEVPKSQQQLQGGSSRSTNSEDENARQTSGDVHVEIQEQANSCIPAQQQSHMPIYDHPQPPPSIGNGPSNPFGGIMAGQVVPGPSPPTEKSSFFSAPDQPAVRQNHALQDYQMQLMLLEHQDKKRKITIAQGKELNDSHYRPRLDRAGERGTPPPTSPSPYPAEKANVEITSQTASVRYNLTRTVVEYADDMPLLFTWDDDGRDTSRNRIDEDPGGECASNEPLDSSIPPRSSTSSFATAIIPSSDWLRSTTIDKQSNIDMPLSIPMRTLEQHNDNRSIMSKNEEMADEAITILLNPDSNRKSKSPVQTSEADKKALADYQMSHLIGLNCRYNPTRLKMYRIDGGENLPTGSQIPSGPFFSLGEESGISDFAVPDDALKDFDFDSFLQQSGDDNFNFDSYTFSNQSQAIGDEQNTSLPSTNLERESNDDANTPEEVEDNPLFVNKKQFNRILKRRVARQELEQRLSSAKLPTTLIRGPAVRLTAEILKQQQQREGDTRNTPSVEAPVSRDKDIELAWSFPALSPAQTSRLWWQAYISFIATSSRQSPIFTGIRIQLERQLGLVASQYVSDRDICRRIIDNVRPLSIAGSTLHEERPELRDVLFLRGEIVRILMTVDQKLGLETATLGWSCVAIFLSIFGKSINATSTLTPSLIALLHKSFALLQEIVHIIARYAVMENLYQQSISSGTKTTLSLKPEYQSSLLSLCSSILEWFSVSYSVGLIVVSAKSAEVEGVEEMMWRWEGLMEEIREKNRGCQIFRVEVDVQEEESESEESQEVDTEDEDESDGSWEAIDELSVGVGSE